MAKMIPSLEPRRTKSQAEVNIYYLLQEGLSNEFTVIHSLPWLCKAERSINKNNTPTGEVDFIILHPEFGGLVLEVKGGRYKIRNGQFISQFSNTARDPVIQLRNSVHGLTRWLGEDTSLRIRLGYAFVFPNSYFGDQIINAALHDITVHPPQRIIIDCSDVANIAQRIKEIMCYWQLSGGTHCLGKKKIGLIVDKLCPNYDGTPSWEMRVEYDNKQWLRLTKEQSVILNLALQKERMVITGWPGTGKTILGIEIAANAAKIQKKTLIIVFNKLLSEDIKTRTTPFKDYCDVYTWHSLCSEAHKLLGLPLSNELDWFQSGCFEHLKQVLEQSLIREYDYLVIDEAQVLKPQWIEFLISWFKGKHIYAFCDETQVFSFEKESTSLEQLCDLLEVKPKFLSVVLRTPKAVTDHLVQIKQDTACQLSTPREYDQDTLQEVVSNKYKCLHQVLGEFKEKNYSSDTITVLFKSIFVENDLIIDIIKEYSVKTETVSKFRGMESPIVIVFGAEEMDDIELFCAYSRATTLCIVLYDADSNNLETPRTIFHQHIASKEEFQQLIHQARENTPTSIFWNESHIFSELRSVKLAWSIRMCGWIVQLESKIDTSETWIDYLALYFRWPVYYWYKDSRNHIYCVNSINELELDESDYWLKYCPDCDDILPHNRIDRDKDLCLRCEKDEDYDDISEDEIENIKYYDQFICSLIEEPDSHKNKAKELPIPLAIVAARKYADSKRIRNLPEKCTLPSYQNLLYRWATAFTYSRIIVSKSTIDRDKLAERLYTSYETWDNKVSLKDWKRNLAQAFSICLTYKKIIVKAENKKGLFKAAHTVQDGVI